MTTIEVRDSYRVARVIAAGARITDGIILIVGTVANISGAR